MTLKALPGIYIGQYTKQHFTLYGVVLLFPSAQGSRLLPSRSNLSDSVGHGPIQSWNPYVNLGICTALWIFWALTFYEQGLRQRRITREQHLETAHGTAS